MEQYAARLAAVGFPPPSSFPTLTVTATLQPTAIYTVRQMGGDGKGRKRGQEEEWYGQEGTFENKALYMS